ncbi:probable FAD synthase [Anoplophora glabripennis]|nr:probable FAD synthase [Anoplophora glabripennis]
MFKTVAVILVCDLFLQGKQDDVLKKLLTELSYLNYLVKKFSVLHENERIVTNELKTLSKQFDIVIVVGKLSNDIIFKALANITFQDRTENTKFKAVLDNLQESNNYQLPVTCKLLTGNDLVYPVIHMQTIFVLNEIYMENHLNILKKRLAQYRSETKYKKTVHIQKNGNTSQILDKIKNLQTRMVCQNNSNKISITLESTNFDDIVEVEKTIQREFSNNLIDSYIINSDLENIYADPDDRIQQAIEVIEKGLREYGPHNVFLSFNGGKDCTVLLHLICTVLKAKYPNCKSPIVCLYVRSKNAFPEQDKFISQCQTYFNLEVITVTGSIKEALNKILLMKLNLKACFMGTRRTDPYSSNLKVFQMSDRDWPQVMRMSPLLDWHYSDIWDYLLYYKVPYCKLYDMGYTSLGNASNTVRNPSLLYHDIYLDTEIYLPAYKMLNENKERSGRNI